MKNSSSGLRIGFVSLWFERGQAYVTRALRDALSVNHETYLFARTGVVNGERKLRTDGEWNVPNLTPYPEYKIPAPVLVDWIEDNDLDAVIFNEEYDWELVEAVKETGIGLLTYLDYYKEEWAPYMSLYDGVLCSTLRSFRMMKEVCRAMYIGWTVDLDLFAPTPHIDDKHTFYHNAGWLGINYRKMTPAVIVAFDAISDRLPESSLFVHAQAPLEKLPPEVISIVRENSRITYHVETVPAPGLYHKGRILVFPSKLEGLGLPLPEGLSSGMPAIATNAPPMNEFVQHGHNGLLVDVAETKTRQDNIAFPETIVDVEDLARKMFMLGRDEKMCKRMARQARSTAEATFSQRNFQTAAENAVRRSIDTDSPRFSRPRSAEGLPAGPAARSLSTNHRHIFVIGLRRSGTTIFWKTLRQDQRLRCYDEPFSPHHRLYVANNRDSRKENVREYLEDPSIVHDHWSTIQPYEELLPQLLGHQKTYIQALVETHRNVCIDFVRCHLKIQELRELVPDALIVHLVRDPRAWVTSHLRPYGEWYDNLPENFFNFEGSFNYWRYQQLSEVAGFEGYAHEQLLQTWELLTSRVEQAEPDLTVQFETFATSPAETVSSIYEQIDLDYVDRSYSNIHAPNPPYDSENPRWKNAITRFISRENQEFVYDNYIPEGAHPVS